MPTSPLLCRSPTAAQLICCDLPHGESSGTSSPPTPPSLSASDELEDTCCFDYVQPCDSPDCEEEVCDDEDCVISLSSPPCAGCGEARMERRSSSSRAEGEHEVQRVQGGGVVGNGQGEVLECSCGFQESSSWECSLEMGGGAFGEFEQYVSTQLEEGNSTAGADRRLTLTTLSFSGPVGLLPPILYALSADPNGSDGGVGCVLSTEGCDDGDGRLHRSLGIREPVDPERARVRQDGQFHPVVVHIRLS